MPKLILSMDGLVLKEIELDKERISIGRRSTNDIQIDNLAISGEHAVITSILDDAFLEDRNSTNGTYVNGQPVKKHVLRNNDVIELGKYRLKFLTGASPGRLSAAEMVDASALKPFELPPVAAEAGPAAGESVRTQVLPTDALARGGRDAATAVGVLQVLSGPNAGRELELSKPLTTLGKPGRQVAVVSRRPEAYFISHVEGERFPVVNGRSLGPRAEVLAERDIIEIAGVKMAFFLRPGA
jgi:hypothetical protein